MLASNPSRSFNPRPPTPYCSFKRSERLPSGRYRLWKIHSGVVRTLTWDEEGNMMTLGFWGSGSVVGAPICSVWPFEIQCLTDVLAEQLSLSSPIPQVVAIEQAYQAIELLRILHQRHVEHRLLQFLCWFVEKFGQPTPKGQSLKLKITHQEIADTIGSTRVTVTRCLKQLESLGKLKWSVQERLIYHQTFKDVSFALEEKTA